MKRVLAIWLSNWPVQRVTLVRPELAGRVVVLHGPSRRGESVAACSAAAARAGVEAGMPLAEAVALLSRHQSESSGPLSLEERVGERGDAGTCFQPRSDEGNAGTHYLTPSPHPSPQGGGERKNLFEPHNPAADRAALIALAQWCHQFSPCVGLEDAELPEALLLDATNLAPLYGGEEALVEQVARALRRRGLEARLAIANTVNAALGLARYSLSPGLCPGVAIEKIPHEQGDPRAEPGAERGEPALPLAALRLPDELLETLAHLGLTCVGDVLALPREQLRSRFGPLLLTRINQFTGTTPEVIQAVDPPEEFAVAEEFEHPLTQGEGIRFFVERLLERLAWLLAARRAGALAVACRFKCEGAPGAAIEFALFRPTACARHLWELAGLQLERLRLAGPVEAIEIRVLRHAPLAERQGGLFDDQRSLDSSRQLAALVDRLAGRLGPKAVVSVKLVRDAQPELAYREESLVGRRRRRSEQASTRTRARRGKDKSKGATAQGRESEPVSGALERPLSLLARPVAVPMASVVPDGPPLWFRHRGQRYDVKQHWGPERIETGWWRRERAVRDYYRVETDEGCRFWLFRRRDGRWFLQGNF